MLEVTQKIDPTGALTVPEADPPLHSAVVFEIPIQRAAMSSAMAQKFIERLGRWQRKA